MSEQSDESYSPTYVTYATVPAIKAGEKPMILFIDETDELVNAEESKAKFNREMPAGIRDCSVGVGVTSFHAHPADEAQDYLLITPRDGSPTFQWGDMVDIEDVLKLSRGNQ